MQFYEYVEKFRIDIDKFIKKAKISRASFYHYYNGTKIPHFKTAIRLEEACDKHVSVEEFRDPKNGKRKKRAS